MITVDRINYDFKCQIARMMEIRASEISGQMLDRSYFADIEGTYMNYEVTLEYPPRDQNSYESFLSLLNAPTGSHTFILPYDRSEITIVGRVEQISDNYVRLPGGKVFWKGTSFSILSNHPTKSLTLGEAITAGMSQPPESGAAQIGDTYTYTDSGWIPTNYIDADDIYY